MYGNKKRVVVLGSTGSIGMQTLDVCKQHEDRLEVVALAAGTSGAKLVKQARKFGVRSIALGSAEARKIRADVSGIHVGYGPQAVVDLCRVADADIVVNALVGAAGLRASYETLKAGKVLALANKESLVVGGDLIMPMATHQTLLPIDSEHGAIYQCLLGEDPREVNRLWVTASGGPFFGKTADELTDITPEVALKHPTWSMGAKISIDSSTLMNKGLEVIEAHHLFDMDYDRINVVVQPQSAIHSMVEFTDGSVKAHLGTTDMRIPIQFALSFPDRWSAPVAPLDFTELGSLDFAQADTDTFRCLALAREAGKTGGTLPCAMNAANEVAVAAFLAGECSWLSIADTVEEVMNRHHVERVADLDQLEAVDADSREVARRFIDDSAFGNGRLF